MSTIYKNIIIFRNRDDLSEISPFNKILFSKNFNVDKLLFNLYVLPVKTLNIRINNNFYKNIFFHFMLINSSI